MRRKIEQELLRWKADPYRKPLLVMGARQVGKTYSIQEFARASYQHLVMFDFSAQHTIASLFEGDVTPEALLPQLRVVSHEAIDPEDTLLFFDEIQACPRALLALKYFYEQAPEYHIIAAGSLLGVALARDEFSFPVGKVDTLTMHPMDFEEYLWARGDEELAGLISDAYQTNTKFGLHDHALSRLNDYLIWGGMPEAVSRGVSGATDEEVRILQNSLMNAYVADMAQYAQPLDAAKILNVWRGIPEQLAKANHKFQYTTISSSARAHQYEAPIIWLTAAGLVTPCYRVREGLHPLSAYVEHDFFKLYLLDVGLLGSAQGLDRTDLDPAPDKGAYLRGGLTENFVLQQLVAHDIEAFYWGTVSKSEVDFVFQSAQGDVIPIEVKSGSNVSARSLEAYRQAYCPSTVIRISRRNFGSENGIKSVPLYAAHCIR